MKLSIRKFVLIGCLLIANLSMVYGKAHFTWSAEFDRAYELVFRFEFESAKTILESASLEDPDNLVPAYIQSDIDLIQFINTEQKGDKAQLFNHYDVLLKRVSSLPKSHPRRASILGELYLKRGFVHLSSESNLSAAMDVYRSYNLSDCLSARFTIVAQYARVGHYAARYGSNTGKLPMVRVRGWT